MIELPLVFMSGILGSAHCLGMCGPFALAIGANARDWRANLGRQATYTVGRVFTYTFLGTCAAMGGASLSRSAKSWLEVPALLSIVAGVVLLVQGCMSAGLLRHGAWGNSRMRHASCMAAQFFSTFLRAPGATGVFFAGLLTGFLPCGLVYAMLALAASSASLVQGATTMALFGLGTAPGMMITGWSGSLLSMHWRVRLLHVASWCLIAAGLMSIIRGVGFLPVFQSEPAGCPFCAH